MRIVAIANQKGGVGKTTTATALASGLNRKEFKTLLIDTDPQSNASDTYDAIPDMPSIFDVFENKVPAIEAIQSTNQGDIIAGNLRMSSADMTFTKQGREYILKKALKLIERQYDYIIIDTPPALGIITINALTAAHSLIIPMLADRYSLQGIAQLSETIKTVKEYSNPDLRIDGILLTRYNPRTVLNRDIREAIEEQAESWNTKVFATAIRQGIAVAEAQTQQESLFSYAPNSTVGKDYAAFVAEYEREDVNV